MAFEKTLANEEKNENNFFGNDSAVTSYKEQSIKRTSGVSKHQFQTKKIFQMNLSNQSRNKTVIRTWTTSLTMKLTSI